MGQSDKLNVKLLREAAEQGDAEAQSDLGVLYETGLGVRRTASGP